ncbi:MAG: hypothetical protein MZU95_08590 [Desulfomicrobium escambiense]|nr:hypothetical protein [Desulfomicrobium escambiense]
MAVIIAAAGLHPADLGQQGNPGIRVSPVRKSRHGPPGGRRRGYARETASWRSTG